MDIVRELDAEIDRARSTLRQKLSGSSAPTDQRGKFMEDVLFATECVIRLQLVRQCDDLPYDQFRTLLEAYVKKLDALKQEAWAMMGSDFAVLRVALDEQVRVAHTVAYFVREQKGAVPNWLARAFTLIVATLISEAGAAGGLNDRLTGVSLKTVYDAQIAQALGAAAPAEPQP